MTKNTTDLREQIYKIFSELGVPSADSGGMEKPYVIDAADEILALISNREKLARLDELYEAHEYNNANDPLYYSKRIKELESLRKELDGEEPTNE